MPGLGAAACACPCVPVLALRSRGRHTLRQDLLGCEGVPVISATSSLLFCTETSAGNLERLLEGPGSSEGSEGQSRLRGCA